MHRTTGAQLTGTSVCQIARKRRAKVRRGPRAAAADPEPVLGRRAEDPRAAQGPGHDEARVSALPALPADPLPIPSRRRDGSLLQLASLRRGVRARPRWDRRHL